MPLKTKPEDQLIQIELVGYVFHKFCWIDFALVLFQLYWFQIYSSFKISSSRQFDPKNFLHWNYGYIDLSYDNSFFWPPNLSQIPVIKQPFPGNSNPFSINPTIMQVKISEKSTINFSTLEWLYPRPANGKKLILW